MTLANIFLKFSKHALVLVYFTVDCSTQPVLLFAPHARAAAAYERFMRAVMGLDVSNGRLSRTAPLLAIATQLLKLYLRL